MVRVARRFRLCGRNRSAAAYAKQESNIPLGKPDTAIRLHSYQDLAEFILRSRAQSLQKT